MAGFPAVRLNEKVLLNWEDEDCCGPYPPSSRSTFDVNTTGWSRGLEVTGGGTGVVSHAGLVLLRELADRTGLTAGLSTALPSPAGGHDRGRVFADLACAIADGARVISDFRVMGDQRELFAPVASVPTAWRALSESPPAGPGPAECHCCGEQGAAARVGAGRTAAAGPDRGPGPQGTACIRLDATVVQAHSDKELAEANFKGIIRCSRPAITRASRWPGCSALAPPGRTRRPITCGCSARPSRHSACAATAADGHLRRGRRQP